MEESLKSLDEWYELVGDQSGDAPDGAVLEALLDDLNTPRALAELHGLRHRAEAGDHLAHEKLAGSLRLLGFLGDNAASWADRRRKACDIDSVKVESLIAARSAARKAKDFAESDRIRD
jgi:cysteinyl-tRNA synthetase